MIYFNTTVMELDYLIRIIWIIVFFLFAITLIFIWSKVLIISRKLTTISAIIKKSQELTAETSRLDSPDGQTQEPAKS